MAPLILPFGGKTPRIHPTAWIAPTAIVIGDVEIGPETGIWYGCVVRGDVNEIRIGARTNIQDGTVIHVAAEGQGTRSPSGTWCCCTPARSRATPSSA
jgi:carbonic anhydrase/acetyltransferase-like protein (isoleucine patch superfamily)